MPFWLRSRLDSVAFKECLPTGYFLRRPSLPLAEKNRCVWRPEVLLLVKGATSAGDTELVSSSSSRSETVTCGAWCVFFYSVMRVALSRRATYGELHLKGNLNSLKRVLVARTTPSISAVIRPPVRYKQCAVVTAKTNRFDAPGHQEKRSSSRVKGEARRLARERATPSSTSCAIIPDRYKTRRTRAMATRACSWRGTKAQRA